jgi:predicted alpha/beta hydrolase family esterase
MRALGFLLIASTALASGSFRDVDLDEAVRHAVAVIVAERAGGRWRVLEVMHWRGEAGKQPAGAISVAGPNQEFNEAIGKQIQEHGYQNIPAPIWPRYASSLDDKHLVRAKRVILLLRPWRSDWQLAIEGAWEALAKKDAVAAAIARTEKK